MLIFVSFDSISYILPCTLQLVDKRDVTFEKTAIKAFTGQGQSVGGDEQPSRLIPSIVHKSAVSSAEKSTSVIESSIPGKFC